IYPSYDNRLEAALAEIVDILGNTVPETQQRWYSLKLFERDVRTKEQLLLSSFQEKEIEEVIQITEKIFQDESEAIIINERYAFIARL
ncbi:ferrous iron transport protein B, partial [Streptococcus suis]